MEPRRGPLTAGEKVQFTDRKGKKITGQLVAGGSTQTEHGLILHDDVIGKTEGTVILTVHAKREAQVNQVYPEKDKNKPWKSSRAIGGWEYAVMRPRLADYVLSMPRGAQIMYPKDIAQVIQLGDIRSGMRVLESGAGSGAMSVNLLDAVGERGHLTTIELRPEFAKVAQANATLYYGEAPSWWDLKTGDFDSVAAELPEHWFDRIMLDMLDPWNRLEQAYRVIAPGGVLVSYVTTTTQMSRTGRSPARGRLLDRAADPGIVRTHMEGPGPRRTPRPPDDRSYRFPCYLARHGLRVRGAQKARSRDQGHTDRHRLAHRRTA